MASDAAEPDDHRSEPSLSEATTAELLARWAPLQLELSKRFGNSNIVGCYGEQLVASALGGRLRANSAAGGDVELPDGRVVEVKCRRTGDSASRFSSGIYRWDGAIDGWPFDFAAFVQLSEQTLEPVRAFLLESSRLGEPKRFGTKSPVIGQELYANRRYPGEIDLLEAIRSGSIVTLSAGPRTDRSESTVTSHLPARAVTTSTEPVNATPDGIGRPIDWIWLANGAIDEFKRWRMRRGATAASTSSYASGARAFLRFCRSIERHPREGDHGFVGYLTSAGDITPRARSDYQSHARAFVRFLNERLQD